MILFNTYLFNLVLELFPSFVFGKSTALAEEIEAKGRLTRRFTASRSVLKRKWKGGLKNVDSSFRGLSTIMLRGIVKSNLQYSTISSKNRNGAYGVKGWVSSK